MGPDFIVLTWDPVPGATRYQILVDQNESGEWDDHYSSEPFFRLEGLEPGARVRIVVRVREIAGERVSWPASDPVLLPEPGPVTGVKAVERGSDFIVWAWDPWPGATLYQILLYMDGGYEREVHYRSEPSFRLEGLEPGGAARIIVRVREIAGERVSWPGSVAVQTETLPPPPRRCTNERRLALRYSDFVSEWDGTPFRVDVVGDFPDYVTETDLESLLVPVGLLEDKIEAQLGYRIVEMGDVIPVPDGTPPGWNGDEKTYNRTCPLSRDRGQIHFIYLDKTIDTPRGQAGAVAFPRCGSFAIVKTESGIGHDWPGRDWGGPTMHELFHVFGFAHIEDYDGRRGVPMSRALDDSAATLGAESAIWVDIDYLRCIFPEGG